jgi:hypothetical protein
MRIIEKVALSLILPALMIANVYGEEPSTATVESCSTPPACPPDPATCCKESTKEESTIQETTTTEETTKEETTTKKTTKKETTTEEDLSGCGYPPACPPDSAKCCKRSLQEEPSTE